MTIRLLSVSTGKTTTKILRQLIRRSEGAIELALHIGDSDSDIKGSALVRMDRRRGTQPHLMSDRMFMGNAMSMIMNENFNQHLSDFVDHLHRKNNRYAYRSHNLGSIHDYIDYYFILYDALLQRMLDARVSHVLFFDIPHQGYDTIVWHIAKSLNLPCLFLSQAPQFSGRFFSMRSVETLGLFRAPSGAHTPYLLNPNSTDDLFYMKGVRQGSDLPKGRITAKGFFHLLFFIALKTPQTFLAPKKFGELIIRMHRICAEFPDWRDPFANYFHENELAYFEHLAQYEKCSIDYDDAFVYFPLHLQPEMTTSALGDMFRDQALAIEQLARIVPSDVKIYVKENPKQGSYMRGPLFFHRLTRIPNVKFLPSYADTHKLLKCAKWVATVTGTVGWEAIQNHRKVLVFGKAWYRGLPGVIPYRDDVTYEDIENYSFDLDDLARKAGYLFEQSHKGVIARHYRETASDFDEEANIRNVSETIFKLLLSQIPTSFSLP